jgi:hypothetical protein
MEFHKCRKGTHESFSNGCCRHVLLEIFFYLLEYYTYLAVHKRTYFTWFKPCATGQIGYALVPMIARGAMLGPDQPVIIHMLDIAPAADALHGVKMELIDAAFPLLKGIITQCVCKIQYLLVGSDFMAINLDPTFGFWHNRCCCYNRRC